MKGAFTAKAHGRVNLIGEHTDYNGGWVLPTPIPQYTEVTLRKNESNTIHVESHSESVKQNRISNYHLGQEVHQGNWMDYIQGVTKLLETFASLKGQSFTGFVARIFSNIPEGSGLSSSAALEMSLLKAIRAAFDLNVTDIELAKLGQKVENEFVGARVGIMDQMATAFAESGEALFLDTYHLTYEKIKLPLDNMDILILNSGISHKLSSKEGYNRRRQECEEACQILKIKHLRDADLNSLDKLPPLLKKRVRHVITENSRVFAAASAIKNLDLDELGSLFKKSHESMRDDYEVSLPEIDSLVEICSEYPEVYGARLTGGGFGGSVVAITKKDYSKIISSEIIRKYKEKTNYHATMMT